MRIAHSEITAGQPIRRVRDFLRKLGNRSWDADDIAEHFRINEAAADKLIAALVERNLLEIAEA